MHILAVTHLEQSRSGIDVKAIREQMPDIAAKFTTSTTYRVLRFKIVNKSNGKDENEQQSAIQAKNLEGFKL